MAKRPKEEGQAGAGGFLRFSMPSHRQEQKAAAHKRPQAILSPVVAMLLRKPVGASKISTERWQATNRLTVENFLAFWQKLRPDLSFPGTKAGEEAPYVEW